MNETRLRTIEQIEQFLSTSEQIAFAAHGDDSDRYEHISRVLKRFDFPQRSKRERGVLREYLQAASMTESKLTHFSSIFRLYAKHGWSSQFVALVAGAAAGWNFRMPEFAMPSSAEHLLRAAAIDSREAARR
jgi:hypothetical protein